eukprot:1013894-Pyramimonas_sp.AAC.1
MKSRFLPPPAQLCQAIPPGALGVAPPALSAPPLPLGAAPVDWAAIAMAPPSERLAEREC